MEETLYFAYGSNINLEQMEHRCPDALLVGPVTLQNYELQFRGSGFATVAPKKDCVVHGLLWKLTPSCEQSLDRYEGYPRHYIKEAVTVQTADGSKFPSWLTSWRNRCAASPHCRIHAITAQFSKVLKQTACRWSRWRKRGTGPSMKYAPERWRDPTDPKARNIEI